MRTGKIVYFDRAGQGNTATVIEVVQERCAKLGIQHVVVASDSGETALRLWEALQETGVSLISVPEHAGYAGGDEPSITPEKKKWGGPSRKSLAALRPRRSSRTH
jgi:hypothetical protein